MRNRLCALALALCAPLAMVACNSARDDWATATRANTAAAYEAFIERHPGDPHQDEATAYVLQLQDDADWKLAQSGNSVASYARYLQSDPRGTHAAEARLHLEGLERANAWKSAQAGGSAADLRAFLQKYPLGSEAEEARHKLESLHADYRVSLGRFASEGAAMKKRTAVQARFPKVLQEVDVLAPATPGRQYRVTSGLMQHRDADSLCKSLRRDHQNCEVIRTGDATT